MLNDLATKVGRAAGLGVLLASGIAYAAICGDGVVDGLEQCDVGTDDAGASCCTATCTWRPYGSFCEEDGDPCTRDTCDSAGRCAHEVAPDPRCAVPLAARGGSLTMRARSNGDGQVRFKWRRGPAIELDDVADAPSAPNRFCVYDQRGGTYALLQDAASIDGRWKPSGLGWRFRGASRHVDGVNRIVVKPNTTLRASVDVRSRDATLASRLPPLQHRRVVAQFHWAERCVGASFTTARRSDARSFRATSEPATLVDTNDNGVREWMFIGDSNTKFLPCTYVSQLTLRHPDVTAVNEAVFGSAAFGWVGEALLPALLDRHAPDAVLIALGTNDLATRSAQQILGDLRTLHDQVVEQSLPNGASPLAYVATVSPVYLAEGAFDAKIEAVNAGIRSWLPAGAIADFDTWMPEEWDASVMWWPGDGLHVGCGGHARRADVLDLMVGN